MDDFSTKTDVSGHRTSHPMVWVLIGMAALGLILWLATMIKTGISVKPANSFTGNQESALDFSVKDLSGNSVNLSSLRGQTVLVNFWATWCTPCKEEMPLLQAYFDAHNQDGFVLVGVNVSDDIEDAQAFIAEHGYTFPVWSDPPGNVLIDLNMNGLPASLVVDPEGIVVQRWIGPLTQEDLDTVISPLLSGAK